MAKLPCGEMRVRVLFLCHCFACFALLALLSTVSAGLLASDALSPVRAAAASMMLRPHARIGELHYCSTP